MTLALRTLLSQLVASIVTGVLVAIFLHGWLFSFSLGLATMIVAHVGVLTVMWYFEYYRQPPKRLVRWYYFAQLVKYLVVVLAVIMYLHLTEVIWLPFLIGVLIVQVSGVMLTAHIKRIAYS